MLHDAKPGERFDGMSEVPHTLGDIGSKEQIERSWLPDGFLGGCET